MASDWQDLTKLTDGQPFIVERVRLENQHIAIEGEFELPPLSRLRAEDQIFVVAFVRAHGSIKEMERLFGVSYPTIKNRLNRIAGQLEFVEIRIQPSTSEVLEALERGEMSVAEALEKLKR